MTFADNQKNPASFLSFDLSDFSTDIDEFAGITRIQNKQDIFWPLNNKLPLTASEINAVLDNNQVAKIPIDTFFLDSQVGYHLSGNVYFVAEYQMDDYQMNDYQPLDVDNLAMGFGYKMTW